MGIEIDFLAVGEASKSGDAIALRYGDLFGSRSAQRVVVIDGCKRKDRVLNLRVSDRQRGAYERAAALEGVSVSAMVTAAADTRAEELLHAHASVSVPSEVFDGLLAALDQPSVLAPALEKALVERRFQNR